VGAARNIKTFYENLDDDSSPQFVAERLVFLGFGFHEQNMQLIRNKIKRDGRLTILATVFGVKPHSADAIREALSHYFMPPPLPGHEAFSVLRTPDQVILASPETDCNRFFDEFYHVLK
jgi:hypothetical protein